MVSTARSEALTPANRETLLENLEKIRASVDAKVDARFRSALSAYRTAIASDEAAMDFYLKCVEKLDFVDQKKRGSDFREWKGQQESLLSDSGFKLALRYQIQWLILTLRASSEKAKIESLASEAQELVDGILANAEKMKHHEKTLIQPVTSTVFAKIFDITEPKNSKWPLSPLQLDVVYEQVIFPPLRTPGKVKNLAAAWVKRISQEQAKIDTFEDPNRQEKKDKRIGMASALKSPEYEKFMENVMPTLQWQMEMDLFRNGDEIGAAQRMLIHIEKYINHKASREWADAFIALLNPKPIEQPIAAPEIKSTAPAP